MYSSKNSEDSVQCNTISNGKVSDGKYKKDELIDAVFRKVNLPEVHFIQSSPPISSPKTTSVPPNSVRSEIGEINIFEGENELIPRKSSTPQRQSPLSQCEDYNDEDIVKEEDDNFEIEKKQQKLNDEIKINLTNIMLVNEEKIKNEEIEIQQVEITLTESSPEINKKLNIKMTENKKEEEEEEEEEEELSIHLLAHKNSLDNGNIKCSTNTEINNKLKKEMEEEEEIEEIPLTPSTGEGCLDSVRSIIATNGETPTKIISEDDWSEQNNNIIDDNECRRVSSTISRELVNSVIELAIQQIITTKPINTLMKYTYYTKND
uniref:Uncharacterized protein n=1 Tax=Meloidogyne hapla TaxID=6305 RepID=A0A1I8BFW1_MELHA